jgi:hypothetical protein
MRFGAIQVSRVVDLRDGSEDHPCRACRAHLDPGREAIHGERGGLGALALP